MNKSILYSRQKLSVITLSGVLLCIGVLFYTTKPDTTADVSRPSLTAKLNYETANVFEIYETMRKKILSHAVNLEDTDFLALLLRTIRN